jgi:uncharacterized protein YgiM (DUF1202 family)
MLKDDLIELYNTVPEGTPVWIHSGKSTGKWEGDPSFAVQPTNGKVKVTVNLANVRTGPSLGAFIIQQEKTASILKLTGFIQDWYQVKTSNGKIGFIHKSTVQRISGNSGGNNIGQTPSFTPQNGTVEITASIANIRSNPSLNAPIVQKVKKGTKLTLTGISKEWYQIRLSSGYTTYVHQSVAHKLTQTAQTAKQYVTVTVNLANIRIAPSENATIILRVANGTKLEKVGTNGDWFIVELKDGRTGFIHKTVVR